MVQLSKDERIDYLLADESMRIIQSKEVFSFSLDAILLAHFTYVPIKRGKILDLCTGNGVIPLLLSRRSQAKMTGVEIQRRLFDMAVRNMELNNLSNRIHVIHEDLNHLQGQLSHSSFDVVTCNPPYFKSPKETERNLNEHLMIARHEVLCTLEEVVQACKRYVRPGGKVAMVHRPERLVDILTLLREHRIEPKRMRLVYPKVNREANTLLVEGIRDGKPGLIIEDPLYVYTKDGEYTKEAGAIIYGNR